MIFGETLKQANEALKRGSRILALAFSKDKIDNKNIKMPEKISKLALIEITDPIREGARETLEYLRSQKIDLKIISGDNPITVSNIAKKAGFVNFESYIDCSKVKDTELKKNCRKNRNLWSSFTTPKEINYSNTQKSWSHDCNDW